MRTVRLPWCPCTWRENSLASRTERTQSEIRSPCNSLIRHNGRGGTTLDIFPAVRATPRSLVVILSSLVALAPLGVGGCKVGDSPADDDSPGDGDDDDGSTGPDASTDDGDDTGDDTTDDGADDGGEVVDVTQCRDLVPAAEVRPFHHPARFDYTNGDERGCGQNGCHGATPGTGASTSTIGGTVFDAESQGRPVPGATIYVTDQADKPGEGVSRALVSDANGFFWSTEPLTAPFRLAVTAGCPDDPIPMMANAAGNCNAGSGCHASNRQIYSER